MVAKKDCFVKSKMKEFVYLSRKTKKPIPFVRTGLKVFSLKSFFKILSLLYGGWGNKTQKSAISFQLSGRKA
jgi:hypothetical protein